MKKETIILILIFLLLVIALILFKNKEKTSYLDCVNNAKDFLIWYKENESALSALHNKIVQTENTEYYKIDLIASDNYLNKLESSGYVSSALLGKFTNYFSKRGSEFAQNKENEGVPTGFDFDFIIGGQGDDPLTNYIPNRLDIKIRETKKEKQTISINDELNYHFDNSCKLENISFGNYFYLEK